MVEVLFVWGVIWFLYWGNTKPLKARISRLDQGLERVYLLTKIARFKSSASFAGVGALVGSFIGIAGFGSAVAGTVPCSILAGLIGWLAVGGKQ